MPFPEEARLLLCLLLSAFVFASAYRFARSVCDGSPGQAICDAILLFALIIYLAVAGPAILHCLNLATMSITAMALCGGLLTLRRGNPRLIAARWTADHWIALAAALFTGGYLLAYLWEQRWLPPMATDALVYQLSTPVFWMRRHTMAIFPTWYWNPANSYAPQAPATWFFWLMEPLRNDMLARFAQAPALLWIFVLVYRGFSGTTAREGQNLGESRMLDQQTEGTVERLPRTQAVAALVACAAVLSRPLFSEALIAKDDLIVTALFLTAVAAFDRRSLRDRLGPWRVGIAVGLMLASKYTVLLVCPLFLFLIDAPFRAGWKRRDFIIASLTALALAGPWYLRNLLLTGDPLFPADVKLFGMRLFTGLFGTERDQQLRSAGGAWRMLATTYHSLPAVLLAPLALAWIAACAAAGRSVLVNPMRRAALPGSMAVLLLFFLASPHHEVRYLFPLIALWFDSATLAITRWLPGAAARLAAGLLLAGISIATSFNHALLQEIVVLAGTAALISATGLGLLFLLHYRPRLVLPAFLCALLLGATMIYLFWLGYLKNYRAAAAELWSMGYDGASVWGFVRDETQVPADANIAFANTQFDYPLYGFNYARDVAYAPTRRGLHSFLHFPRMGDDVPGDLIVQTMTRIMTEDPDRQTWLDNLAAMQAQYLVVFRHEMVENPVELRFAATDPAHFVPRYSDDTAVVYEIRR